MDKALVTLLEVAPLAPLGPGAPLAPFAEQIAQTCEILPCADPKMKKACEAGLWLMFSFLDKSHALSQEIDSPTGAFWHGIMHRREPDASNAAYWFDRVGDHPLFPSIAQAVSDLLLSEKPQTTEIRFQSLADRWDPIVFIDLCEFLRDSKRTEESLCQKIQRAECRLLFEFSYSQATAL